MCLRETARDLRTLVPALAALLALMLSGCAAFADFSGDVKDARDGLADLSASLADKCPKGQPAALCGVARDFTGAAERTLNGATTGLYSGADIAKDLTQAWSFIESGWAALTALVSKGDGLTAVEPVAFPIPNPYVPPASTAPTVAQ